MHVKSLKLFCDVVGYRSFSQAADVNDISQSGASQIVHQLEERLETRLIDRSKRPFVLTPEGEVFYDGCRKLVRRYYTLEEEVRTLHQEVSGRVSVASIFSVGLSHMNHFVQQFLSQHPKANVHLEYQHTNRVYEFVENDQVDLGLVSYPKSSRTIQATTWREEPMVLVCAPQHYLAGKKSVAIEELHDMPMVCFTDELKIRRKIDRALAERGVSPKVAMEFDNIETIKRAVEIDAGTSLLPEPTILREVEFGSLTIVKLQNIDLVRPLGVIQRRGKHLGKTARTFLQLLLERDSILSTQPNDQERNGDDSKNGETWAAENGHQGDLNKQPAHHAKS